MCSWGPMTFTLTFICASPAPFPSLPLLPFFPLCLSSILPLLPSMQLNSTDQFLPQGRTNIQVNGDRPQIENPTSRAQAAAHGELWLWAPGGLGGFAQPCEERALGSSSLEWLLASGLLPGLFFHFSPLTWPSLPAKRMSQGVKGMRHCSLFKQL